MFIKFAANRLVDTDPIARCDIMGHARRCFNLAKACIVLCVNYNITAKLN